MKTCGIGLILVTEDILNKIYAKLHAFPAPLRAVSVGATRLTDGKVVQLSLFDEEFSEREDRLEKSVDAIRNKYGYKAVKRGVNIGDDLTGGLHEEDDFLPFKR